MSRNKRPKPVYDPDAAMTRTAAAWVLGTLGLIWLVRATWLYANPQFPPAPVWKPDPKATRFPVYMYDQS